MAGSDSPEGEIFSWVGLTSGLQIQGLFLIYDLGFVALSGIILGCYVHAFRLREALQLDAVELYDTRSKMTQWSVMIGGGTASCVRALLIPGDHPIAEFGFLGWAYRSLSFLMLWLGIRANRERKKFLYTNPK
jgi:hypothetical protein